MITTSSENALPPSPAVVAALSTTPVKGLRIGLRPEVRLTRTGAVGDRRFYLVDANARMVNGKQFGALSEVEADYEASAERLTLTFPGDVQVAGTVELGAQIETSFFSSPSTARLVVGPWSELLSRHTGAELRLVQADPAQGGAVDRGPLGGISLISEASVARLAALAGTDVDARRFRMLIGVAGVAAHEEDTWVGRTLRIGPVRIAVHGHVGRCLVTSRSPDTGVVDLPTLELLAYRRDLPTTERLAFGVYGEVLEEGVVRVGDGLRVE